jgi:DNA-binding response OmpR family regulator
MCRFSRHRRRGVTIVNDVEFSGPRVSANVLVVADDARQRELLRMRFEAIGFEVAVARDGGSALDALRFFAPDIVVCDIDMPEFTGEHCVMQMRLRPQFAYTPVMLIGEESVAERLARLPLGPVEYFRTPLDVHALLTRVEFYVCPPEPGLGRSLAHRHVVGI